jgi:tryptophan synthase alpha chain
MSRLQAAFARLRQNGSRGLVTYVTAGDPDLSQSREVIRALARGGADVIEVGVPFSDPIWPHLFS